MIISVCPLLHHGESEQFHFQMSKLLFSLYCHKINVFHSSSSKFTFSQSCLDFSSIRVRPNRDKSIPKEFTETHYVPALAFMRLWRRTRPAGIPSRMVIPIMTKDHVNSAGECRWLNQHYV